MSDIIHLLYAEDNAQDADLTRAHFERTAPDIRLEIAGTGASCLKRLAEQTFDLLLLDNHLPDMDGLDVLAKLRAEGRTLPVVMVTGAGDEEVVVRALRAGAADYASKSNNNYLVTLPDLLRVQVARHRQHLVDGDGEQRTWQILYVEPNQMDVELMARHLAAEAPHLELHTAPSSRDALTLLAPGHHFDLVLTDLRVPDMNAPEFMREAQHRGIKLPFIVITGKGDEASAVAILRLGAYDYIVKRDNYLTHLPHAIDHVLHRFHLDQTTRRLNAELVALNATLEQKVEARTSELQREIAVRKRAEETMKVSEQRLRTLIETEPECVKVVDSRGQLLEMNKAGLAMLEIGTLVEAQKYTLFDYILPEYRDAFRALHKRVMQGENGTLEFEILGLRGTRRRLETHAVPLRDAAGEVTSLLGITRDITERKQVEIQLRLAAKVFEQSSEAFMVTDADTHIVMANQAFTTITGYSEAEALGKTPRMLASGHQDDNFYRAMWESINTLGHWQGEVLDRRKDGSIYPKWLSISRVLDAQGNVTHYIGIFSDISQRKQDEERIQRLAHFDVLTGLPNRVLLNDRISHALSMAQRSHSQLAVLFLDIDHFKNINDSIGHRIGDELLKLVAERLNSVVREEDTVSRLGGDEFILVLQDTDADGAAHVAEKLLASVARPYQIEPYDLIITPSIGISMFPADGENFDTLYQCADVAMYRAKHDGRNNFRFFTPAMQANSTRRLRLENALRHALELNQLCLHYQPQMSLASGRIIGAEALLRWTHPDFGMVSPAEFIPVAEDSGLILPIGEWVLRTAAGQMKSWMDRGMEPMIIAVNLSAVQFRHANLPEKITQILDEVKLLPQYLELELTEGVAMDDPLGAIAVMDNLHGRGIRMSIDDFGTGYSSLSYLKRFKVYKLKIDQSFVQYLTDNPEDKAIVSAIISMSGSLGLQTIAEGVETAGQQAFLLGQGCNEIQGYYFSRPLPAEQFEAFVREICKPEIQRFPG